MSKKSRWSQDYGGFWHYDRSLILIPRFYETSYAGVQLRVWKSPHEGDSTLTVASRKVPKRRWRVEKNTIILTDLNHRKRRGAQTTQKFKLECKGVGFCWETDCTLNEVCPYIAGVRDECHCALCLDRGKTCMCKSCDIWKLLKSCEWRDQCELKEEVSNS